jgi:hypothetical protein
MVQVDVIAGGRPDTLGFIDIKRDLTMDGLQQKARSGRNRAFVFEGSFCVKKGDDVNAVESWRPSVGRVREVIAEALIGKDDSFRPVILIR